MLNLATQISLYCTWVSELLSKYLIRNSKVDIMSKSTFYVSWVWHLEYCFVT